MSDFAVCSHGLINGSHGLSVLPRPYLSKPMLVFVNVIGQ
jgi:hypothetical protein